MSHLHEHGVAGVVAERVVDPLEAVEVDQQQGARARRTEMHRVVEVLEQQQPVAEAGQGIAHGLLNERAFGGALLRDLFELHEQPGVIGAGAGDQRHQRRDEPVLTVLVGDVQLDLRADGVGCDSRLDGVGKYR